MRLAEFITRNTASILAAWEDFAARCLPAALSMNSPELYRDAVDVLSALMLAIAPSPGAGNESQHGEADALSPEGRLTAAAKTHTRLRMDAGFALVQLVGEYHTLRDSVLRLWTEASQQSASGFVQMLEDSRLFNEAIDHAVIESVALFTQEIERTRNLLLAVVGHDLRNPLDTILMISHYLAQLQVEGIAPEVIARLVRSGSRMKHLLDDLSDYNRSALSGRIPVVVADMNLAEVCALEVDAFQTAHKDREVRFVASGELRGMWDAARIQQVLSNLLRNALDYGARDAPIEVRATGLEEEVRLAVHNRGSAIPESTLRHIFEPLKRGDANGDPTHGSANLGLGLYISREIARAHGGTIRASSDEHETVFIVQLPRRVGPVPGSI
jgi:signal transduction histidine kinase